MFALLSSNVRCTLDYRMRIIIGYLKVLYDQLVVARTMTKEMLVDQEFLTRIGLNVIDPNQRYSNLKPSVGFVLSMYGRAENVFNSHSNLSVDEKLFRVMERRFRLYPNIHDSQNRAKSIMQELVTDTPNWNSLTTQDRFRMVCARVFAVRMEGVLGKPQELKTMNHIIDEIFKFIFRQKKFALQ